MLSIYSLLTSVLFCFEMEFSASQGNSSHHRVKRKIESSFQNKHIVALYDLARMNFPTLKRNLPEYLFTTGNRGKHTVLIVHVLYSENKTDRKSDFVAKLNNVMSAKLRNGQCTKRKYNPKGKICLNPSDNKYYHCEVFMDEIEDGIRLVEFNIRNPNDCRFSDKGSFTVGVRVDLKKVWVQEGAEWFFVNHLQWSRLIDGSNCPTQH